MEVRRAESEADRAAARAIRQRVFVEEQACPPEEEWDEHDLPGADCVHLIGLLDGRPVATARWRVVQIGEGEAAKLERFAVLPEHRGSGLGRRMVEAAMADARRSGLDRFVLHAQTYLEGFYAGFGFEPEGEAFTEAGIPHVRMFLGEGPRGKGQGG